MKHSNFLLLLPTFVFLLWMTIPGRCSITSVEEPDWTISKADLVNSLYSYEPYDSSRSGSSSSSGREFRALFPSLFSSGSSSNSQQQQQRRIQHGPSSRPQIKGNYGPPTQFIQPISNNNNNAAGTNNVVQYGPPPLNMNYKQLTTRPSKPDEYTGQPPPIINPGPSQPMIKLLPGSVLPQLTKFSLEDKKVVDSNNNGQQPFPSYGNGGLNNHIPSITSTSTPQGPMYQPNPTPSSIAQQSGGYQNQIPSDPKYSQMSSVDSQTIIWPKQTSEDDLATGANGDDTQVRFLVHKPGDENIIRNALLEDGKERNQEVKFIEGPTLRIQRHQKVYLPPKKKTVVYILLKEPQIHTDVEVVGPTEDPVPEVFITYQKSDGVVKTNHYSPEVVKNDKYLSQLKDTAQSAMGVGGGHQKLSSSSSSSSETLNNSSNAKESQKSSSHQSGGGFGGSLSASGEQNSHVGPHSLSQSQRYYYGVNSFNVDDQQQAASSSVQIQSSQKGPAVHHHLRPVRGSNNSNLAAGPVFPKEKSNEAKRTSSGEQTPSSSSSHNDHTPISCTLTTSQTYSSQSETEKGGHSSSSPTTVAHSTATS